jgi:PAS domain S-box-containing protein
VLWLRWEVRPWLNAAGELGGIVVAIEDITERKRAEVVNARLAAIVDSSDDAIVGNDLEGVITSWNAAAERLFGYAADEAVGSSLALIIPRDRLDEEAEILDQLRRGILVDHYETERLRKDGRLVDVSLTVSLVRDVTGHVVGASKIARDITERKRADKAVAHLAAIVDSSEDSIVSEDLDGLVVSWNAGAQRILGYAPDEAIGRPIDAVLNRPDRPGEATALIANAERGERIRNFETQRLRKDGSLVDVSVNISPIRDRAGKRIGISRIHHDITERKRAEEARRELERMARSIFDSISSHIAVLDESGTILGVNRSWRLFAEANGFVGQANEGANYLDVCDSAAGEDREMAAAFATGIREVLVGQRASFELEYPCHSPSQRRWFIGRVTPFPNGGPRRVVVSHQDVTALKEAEEHLRNRERMLSQSQMMAHVGSWELDLDDLSDLYLGGLRWSEECFRIFGYEPGQVAVTKDLFFQAVHPDDRDAVSAALARALRENGSYGIEHRIVRPDGVERVVFEWGESITNPSGRPIRVLGTCQDITERKRAEEDLRYQLRLNRAITEKVGESIFLIDEQGRLLFLNEEATRVFGFTFEELGGTVLHDAIHHHYPDGRPFPWEECSSASICRTGQGIRSHESTYFRKDGSVVVAVCANAPLEVDGRRIGVVFILHDITERKRSEMDLRHYANRLEHLREIDHAILSSHSPREIAEAAMRHLARLVPYWTAGVSFYDFDRDEVEVLATDGLLREWYPSGNRYQEELKARLEIYALPHEQISIGEEAQTSPLMEALRVAGMRSYVSIPLREGARPAGSLLLVSDSLAGFSAEQIEVAREVADHLAIAIRQAILHEDLRLARARMEALSRQLLRAQEDERRRIARELHDEIGQAMTALKINLQTLIQGGEDGASRLEESVTIVDQTLQQVRGMALDLRPSILDDLGLVAALEWYIGRYTQRTGLLGRFVADPDHIQADPEIETTCFRVAQEALTNVARHARATRFSVELVQHSGGLQLVIRDDGIGFDPEAALGAASRGVSFGLAGMRERVELIGGRIAFVSEPAEGTEIQVDFPETPIMPRNIFEENDPGGPK